MSEAAPEPPKKVSLEDVATVLQNAWWRTLDKDGNPTPEAYILFTKQDQMALRQAFETIEMLVPIKAEVAKLMKNHKAGQNGTSR